jgi:hypothetical protein
MNLETPDDSSTTAFQDLPPHLQHLIYASAAAPLTTCKVSAAVAQDASLTAAWLLTKHQHPLQRAAQHRLWDVCGHLLSTLHCRPGGEELQETMVQSAGKGATAVVAALLQWCCKEHQEGCVQQFSQLLPRLQSMGMWQFASSLASTLPSQQRLCAGLLAQQLQQGNLM